MIGHDCRHYLVSETNWKTVKDMNYDLVVLPWGATESHNYHLPYGTDNIQCESLVSRAAHLAWNDGVRVAVLPGIPFGVQSAQIDIKLNINMRPSTQMSVLHDIVESLAKQGFRKLLLVNGHGGNQFSHMIRELYMEFNVMIFICDWYRAIDMKKIFDAPGDHAGALETSLMMHLAPHLVLPIDQAGSGLAKKMKISSLGENWVWTQRGWLGEVTEDTGVGDPREASAEHGEYIANKVVAKLGQLIREIAHLDLKEKYQ